MRCTSCGGSQFSVSYEEFPLVGLPQVVLEGVRKKTCGDCGEYTIRIPHHQELTQKVTVALLNKRKLLAPLEMKWLRSHLGITSSQLGLLLKVSPTTVSYWENGKRNPSQASDLLLRFLVSTTLAEGSFSFQAGLQVTEPSNVPLQLRLYFEDSQWKVRGDVHEELLVVDLSEPGWGSWSVPQWLKELQAPSAEEFLHESEQT